ncbi:NAD-dependent epimerase/dehydratase family protein [Candidatus Woesearchaeota archaeon]|nr:NAD-dependent epimerase/dehydratase family protein [Candidatus Woesearchaeota archaeon]
MRILVTGGAGFIGSHIVDRLIHRGFKVTVVDSLSTGYLSNINPKAKFYKVDIQNIESLKKVFKKEKPAKVIHAAAQIKVLLSVSDPVYDAKVNIIGGLNVLECCKEFEVKKIAYLSTGGALYGNPKYIPADEDHPINPISPYGISKRALELYLQNYSINFNLDFVSLRFSNVYGPRDEPKSCHVIPLFIHNMLNNESPTIFGDGSQGRDFIYVNDVVDAVMLALDKNPKDKFLNVGTEKLISIYNLFNSIRVLLKMKLEPRYVECRKGEVKEIYLNAKKAEEQLGWKAKINLREGLMETIKWFKEK